MKIRGFITHKRKEKYSDCQDRFKINAESRAIAVSDGMTQSIFPAKWAEILVSAYTDGNWYPSHDSEEMSKCSKEWTDFAFNEVKREDKEEYIRRRLENNLQRRNGAGATFLGIRFQGQKYSGVVLGDSCLVTIVKGKIEKIQSSREDNRFDNYPEYFDSFMSVAKGEPRPIDGELTTDKVLLLVTDAVADFLYRHQDDCKYLDDILRVKNRDDYDGLIDSFRKAGMHDDDCTILIVEYDGKEEFDVEYEDSIDELCKNERKAQEQSCVPVVQKDVIGSQKEELSEDSSVLQPASGQDGASGQPENELKNLIGEFCDKMKALCDEFLQNLQSLCEMSSESTKIKERIRKIRSICNSLKNRVNRKIAGNKGCKHRR